jgi:hypothetical protein
MIIYVERVHLLCIIRCILHIYTCTRRSNYCRCFCVQVRLDLSFQYVGLPETPPPEPVETHETKEQVATDKERIEEAAVKLQSEDTVSESVIESTGLVTEDVAESEAVQKLRTLMEATLSGQMQQLRASVDEQLKTQDKKLSERFASLESTVSTKRTTPSRGGKKK